jgi:hypothetical protein
VRTLPADGSNELADAIADQQPNPVGMFVAIQRQKCGLAGSPAPAACAMIPGQAHLTVLNSIATNTSSRARSIVATLGQSQAGVRGALARAN